MEPPWLQGCGQSLSLLHAENSGGKWIGSLLTALAFATNEAATGKGLSNCMGLGRNSGWRDMLRDHTGVNLRSAPSELREANVTHYRRSRTRQRHSTARGSPPHHHS